ncbi:hypothetical protein NDU88_001607 [Pleurodeles waltl]|uniref:Uncharacterized protein n=1 Tax=Pleurodeles waltl TaxID=8319 RepID=A0AAV7U7H4_PLEWA|nr:hypothetical protein NDU88_001607 [Pleurodeles waltl]
MQTARSLTRDPGDAPILRPADARVVQGREMQPCCIPTGDAALSPGCSGFTPAVSAASGAKPGLSPPRLSLGQSGPGSTSRVCLGRAPPAGPYTAPLSDETKEEAGRRQQQGKEEHFSSCFAGNCD